MNEISRIKQLANIHEEISDVNFVDAFVNAGKANETGTTVDSVDSDELEMGINVEFEHTTDVEIATRIALDHLAEIPDYYTRLAQMEKEGKAAAKQNASK